MVLPYGQSFSDEKVSSEIIDDYVKLFLSACTRLDNLFQVALKKKSKEAASKKANGREVQETCKKICKKREE